eukprot:TRINITY_DN21415_c0_g1_i2.p1 TRINITY_DN21415_c0_g1~~TRINITY_DN21415_c0_g1_i2.p1  ORF type:complete len:461 (+),score=78.02 TRINITY_DN21415_c0_g1_i2:193-1575(+)
MGCLDCLGIVPKDDEEKERRSKWKRRHPPGDSGRGGNQSDDLNMPLGRHAVSRKSSDEESAFGSGSPASFAFTPTQPAKDGVVGAKLASLKIPVPGRGHTMADQDAKDHHVKETRHLTQAQDDEGHKMVNQYVRVRVLGSGSYGKVVLHKSLENGHLYAIKICNKLRLRKLRVAPSETALMDVMREVAILKQLDHPNVVTLVEVIDDPESNKLYLVLQYVEGGSLFEGTGPAGGIGQERALRYFRDALAGLMYLHRHNVVHGDIKPENLLLGADDHIVIADFGVSHMLEDDSDELRRSPGTPVYTAPECCSGVAYHGKTADIWALGCTLYVCILSRYPFLGPTLPATYDKIVHEPLELPEHLDQSLADLLRGLLQKDPEKRMSLEDAAQHPWVTRGGRGPVLQMPSKGLFVNDELIASAFSKSVSTPRGPLGQLDPWIRTPPSARTPRQASDGKAWQGLP